MASNLISMILSFVSDGWFRFDKGFIISVIVLAVTWYAILLKYRAKGEQKLPPGPRGLPLLGNLPFLKPDLHTYFTKLAEIYGPIFKLQLGSKLCVVVSSPSLAKEIFKEKDAVFANHNLSIVGSILSHGGSDIAFNPYGPNWRMMRKVFVRELMSNTGLDATYKLRQNEVQQMVREVYSKRGTPIDIGNLVFVTMLNMIMSMLWGGKLKEEEKSSTGIEFRKVTAEMISLLGKTNVSDLFPILAKFDVQGMEKKAKKLISWMHHFLDSVIDERLQMNREQEKRGKEHMESKDFLQILLELMQHGDGEISLNMIQLKDLLLDIFTGATDTTTTTLEWALAEMMQHPNIMKKAQEELAQVVGMDSMVEESNLSKFPYLNAVVKETLRMHPAIPLLVPHCPSQSCTIGQHIIPKGTDVFFNVWKMHRDTEAWSNPSVFLPERFSSDTNNEYDYKGNNYNYLPFGSGRRICPGIPLAERISTYLLASLLHSFDWHLPENVSVDLSEEFGLLLKKAKPLVIIPTRRLPNVELYI